MLANPAHAALTGPQAHLALSKGRAVRYRPEIAPFAALPLDADAADWADLASLVEPGDMLVLAGPPRVVPAVWESPMAISGVQMVGEAMEVRPEPEALELGEADVPEMIDLVERTKPGPFRDETIRMGRYLGVRRDGRLVAMAGERMGLPGYTEISAVCTDPSVRGEGLASRLVRAVGHGIRERGDVPFLHAAAHNVTAIRLYEHLGFVHTRPMTFVGLQLASAAAAGNVTPVHS